jgi:peptide/nickel transport system substrate-binding protein
MGFFKRTKFRSVFLVFGLALGLTALIACGSNTVETVIQTVVVEKVVAGETIVQTVVVEKQVTGETIVQTVVVEKEVTGETVVQTVIVEKQVAGETVVQTVIVEKEVEVQVVAIATPTPAPTIAPALRADRVIVGHDEPYALISQIDPYRSSRGMDIAGGSLYDRLTDLDFSLSPVAKLATDWNVNSDGTAWTYDLREGVKFKNGQDFTSADVIYSWRRLLDPETAIYNASSAPGINRDRIVASGDSTVVFNLDVPNFLFPILISNTQTLIIPDGSTPDQLGAADLGTGPYIFESFTPNSEVWEWRRNPDYWEEVKTDQIQLQSIPDETARIAALKTGQLDLITSIGGAVRTSQAAGLQADPSVRLLTGVPAVGLTMEMNVEMPPFDDINVRTALKMIVDREFLADTVLQGFGLPGNDTPIPLSWPSTFTSDVPQQNLDMAKQLLAEAGFDESNPLEIELFAGDVHPGIMEMVQAYQEMASAAGVKVSILLAPKDQYWDFSGDKAFAISAWGVRIPGQIFNLVYKCGHPWGTSPWCNTEFDSLVETAEGTAGTDERNALYRSAGSILAAEGGLINPVFTLAIDAESIDCGGFIPPFPFYQRNFNNFECIR